MFGELHTKAAKFKSVARVFVWKCVETLISLRPEEYDNKMQQSQRNLVWFVAFEIPHKIVGQSVEQFVWKHSETAGLIREHHIEGIQGCQVP